MTDTSILEHIDLDVDMNLEDVCESYQPSCDSPTEFNIRVGFKCGEKALTKLCRKHLEDTIHILNSPGINVWHAHDKSCSVFYISHWAI